MFNRLKLALLKLSKVLVPLAGLSILIIFLYITPPGILDKVGAVGYSVCHQISDHSFHFGNQQLPLCARCSGMYLGAVVGLIFLNLRYHHSAGTPRKGVIALLILFGIAFAVDGSNSYLSLLKSISPQFKFLPDFYIPNNTLRLFTGSGVGLGIAVALFLSINQSLWKDWDTKPILRKPYDFFWLVALMLGIDLLVLPEWPWLLYPVAFISAGGVLFLLTMIYTVLWTVIMGQENTFLHFGQAWLPILAGLTIALLQITVIDLLRLSLTHTWGGFPLG